MPSIATKESTKIYPGQFGNLVGLRPVTSIPTTTTPNKTRTKKTRTVRITEHTWEKLRGFSHHYHDQPITYDEIIEELVDFYNNEQNKKYSF